MTSANGDRSSSERTGSSSRRPSEFDRSPSGSPLASPGEKSLAEAELVQDKSAPTTTKQKKPKLKRNLSSLWKMLDPPELSHSTGVLHPLVQADQQNHKRKDSAIGTESMATKPYH
jgi:hypothetical protein